MTPEQMRLLHPLTRQTPVHELRNALQACALCWPWSIVKAAVDGYCAAFVAASDPLPANFFEILD